MKRTRLAATLLLVICMIFGSAGNCFASNGKTIDEAVKNTAKYMYITVKNPQVGSIGGEWAVLGLARSGYEVPKEYYQNYYSTVEEYVKACKGNLHEKKYTEYSRLIVALTAIGADPKDVGGYNLLTPLGDFNKTIWQGINGPIWALIALDSGNYEMPNNAAASIQATRKMYVDEILSRQLSDGGFSLFGGTTAASSGDQVSDPDITGMALQALTKYQDRDDVKKVVGEALACMSKMQNSKGGYSSWGTENSESCVQMIVALTELRIPLTDERFVKNGKTLEDNLLSFYQKDKGFLHTKDGTGSSQMAAEQGFYGIVAIQRAQNNKNSLYRMNDAVAMTWKSASEKADDKGIDGLDGKNSDVRKQELTKPGTTFSDISAHKNQPAIEALAGREIIDGMSKDNFKPDATITRAQFATIVVKGLGLAEKTNTVFTDIKKGSWYEGYVASAYAYGIVNGSTSSTFNPEGLITRQEAAAMVARAAKLCGMDTAIDTMSTRDTLSQFADYTTVADWAKPSMAFCYSKEIISTEALEVQPKVAIKRCEIAEMLFRMLTKAELI